MTTEQETGNRTAMQEAIEYLRSGKLLSAAIILEDKFLEKEKQQIIDANNKGWEDGRREKFDESKHFIDAEDYYNKTFKQ